MSQKPLLIVNPNAGGGRAGRVFSELRPVIEGALGAVDVAFTDRAGHGVDVAEAAAREGRPTVVAVGGDGTLNEVVNGVLRGVAARPAPTKVGFIGQGTGGDFRRTLGVEHRLDRYLEVIARGRERTVDVGLVKFVDGQGVRGERYFINILSAGMGGLVDRYVADASRLLGPTAAYFGASLKALVAIERGRLVARVEGGAASGGRDERLATFMIAVCNGRFFGSGMQVAPMADIADGRLEVVSMGGDSKLGFFTTHVRAIYQGTHLEKPGTVHFGCQRIAFELENARDAAATFLLDCDGEPIGGLPAEIEIVPAALTLHA